MRSRPSWRTVFLLGVVAHYLTDDRKNDELLWFVIVWLAFIAAAWVFGVVFDGWRDRRNADQG